MQETFFSVWTKTDFRIIMGTSKVILLLPVSFVFSMAIFLNPQLERLLAIIGEGYIIKPHETYVG